MDSGLARGRRINNEQENHVSALYSDGYHLRQTYDLLRAQVFLAQLVAEVGKELKGRFDRAWEGMPL